MSEPIQSNGADRLTAKGGILDQSWTWVEAHWADLAWGLPSIVLTLATIELTKEFTKLLAKRALGESYNDTIENSIIRLSTLGAAAFWCWILDFQGAWNRMLGAELVFWKAMAVGSVLTATCAIGFVHFLNKFDVLGTMRVRWRRLTKVSKKDLEDDKTTKGHAPITPNRGQ